MLNIKNFVMGLVASIVGIVLVVTVAVPTISNNQVAEGVANAGAINSMINIMPLLIAVGLILGVVTMFITSKD